MAEVKKAEVIRPKTTKHIALRTLSTERDGKVNAGDECNCTERELLTFKQARAI